MTIEEEEQLVYQKTSMALRSWNSVEMSLCILFSVVLTGRQANTLLGIVFYAIENFRSRQQVLDSVCSFALTGGLLQKWKQIDKHLGKRAQKRNRIAHHDLLIIKSAKPGKRYALIESFANPRARMAWEAGAAKPMHIHEIDEAIEEFKALGKEIRALMLAIESLAPKQRQ